MTRIDAPRIGLVLSGGFAKGAYQIGVLKAVAEVFGDGMITYISASSVGVLNAYAYASRTLDIVEDMWRNLPFTGFRSFRNAYSHSPLIIDAINEVAGTADIETPYLYAALLNLTKIKLNYVNLSKIAPEHIKDCLLASVSLPLFARSVEVKGQKYADGAMVDNIPVKPLMKHPFDYAVVVHFDKHNHVFEDRYFDSKLIKINFLDNKVIRDSLSFDSDSISHMITVGYEESMSLFGMVFAKGPDDIEYIYEKIKFVNGLRGKGSFRLTGDVVVNNMNKFLKKLIPSKI
jgi:predicted acylesterase/phospholipase RssA